MQEKVISTSFDSLGLKPELLRAVAEQGYTQPTPIQAQAIPVVLAGKDLLGAGEKPGAATLTGGAIVVLALAANEMASLRRKPAPRAVRV